MIEPRVRVLANQIQVGLTDLFPKFSISLYCKELLGWYLLRLLILYNQIKIEMIFINIYFLGNWRLLGFKYIINSTHVIVTLHGPTKRIFGCLKHGNPPRSFLRDMVSSIF